jgi:hypothetical protein
MNLLQHRIDLVVIRRRGRPTWNSYLGTLRKEAA